MDCPHCETQVVAFAVPEAYRAYVPGEETAVGLCPQCLALEPATEPPEDPAFERVGDSFPTDPETAVPMALLVGLLDSLALYRSEISALLEAVERGGTDPLLVLDRLARDPDIQTDVDLSGRRKQLEQLL